MNLNIYQSNGYADIESILNYKYNGIICPFVFIYGPRGSGKTFNTLWFAYKNNLKFLYLRRKKIQADIARQPEAQPFKKINDVFGSKITTKPINQYLAGFYEYTEAGPDLKNPEIDLDASSTDDKKIIISNKCIGYISSVSTFHNLRSVDFSDVDIIIYDEFIPEPTEHTEDGEADAVFNCYETVSRNRELEGGNPLRLVCLANSNRLSNPIFLSLDLINNVENMRKNGYTYRVIPDRGVLLIDMKNSPISELKSHTALYKLTAGSNYYNMAINNDFAYDNMSNISSIDIKNYSALVCIGPITIYQSKSNTNLFYVSRHKSGSPIMLSESNKDIDFFRRRFGFLWDQYTFNRIMFEEYTCEVYFCKYFKRLK